MTHSELRAIETTLRRAGIAASCHHADGKTIQNLLTAETLLAEAAMFAGAVVDAEQTDNPLLVQRAAGRLLSHIVGFRVELPGITFSHDEAIAYVRNSIEEQT
jgi:hypothetical protein